MGWKRFEYSDRIRHVEEGLGNEKEVQNEVGLSDS